jgi:hypothetical protein
MRTRPSAAAASSTGGPVKGGPRASKNAAVAGTVAQGVAASIAGSAISAAGSTTTFLGGVRKKKLPTSMKRGPPPAAGAPAQGDGDPVGLKKSKKQVVKPARAILVEGIAEEEVPQYGRRVAITGFVPVEDPNAEPLCAREKCPTRTPTDTFGSWDYDDAGKKIFKGSACLNCALVYANSFKLMGPWPSIAQECNENGVFDTDFQDAVDTKTGKKTRTFEETGITRDKESSMSAKVHLRGLNEKQFTERFKQPPSYFNLPLEPLLGVNGFSYMGVVMHEHWSLTGYGTRYTLKLRHGNTMAEWFQKPNEHHCESQSVNMWEQLTTPSLDEAPEIKEFRAHYKKALTAFELDERSGGGPATSSMSPLMALLSGAGNVGSAADALRKMMAEGTLVPPTDADGLPSALSVTASEEVPADRHPLLRMRTKAGLWRPKKMGGDDEGANDGSGGSGSGEEQQSATAEWIENVLGWMVSAWEIPQKKRRLQEKLADPSLKDEHEELRRDLTVVEAAETIGTEQNILVLPDDELTEKMAKLLCHNIAVPETTRSFFYSRKIKRLCRPIVVGESDDLGILLLAVLPFKRSQGSGGGVSLSQDSADGAEEDEVAGLSSAFEQDIFAWVDPALESCCKNDHVKVYLFLRNAAEHFFKPLLEATNSTNISRTVKLISFRKSALRGPCFQGVRCRASAH